MAVTEKAFAQPRPMLPKRFPGNNSLSAVQNPNPVVQRLSPPKNCKWSHERVWDPAQEAGARKVGVAMICYVFFFALHPAICFTYSCTNTGTHALKAGTAAGHDLGCLSRSLERYD